MLLNFCVCITTVNQIQVASSVCDVDSLCTSSNLQFRSKHHKINLAWLRNVFTLFKFICSCITKPTTSKDANFASDELRKFQTKFGVKFTSSVRSSWFDWQLRNEIAKLPVVVNFGNSEQTSEPVHQKLCETLYKQKRKYMEGGKYGWRNETLRNFLWANFYACSAVVCFWCKALTFLWSWKSLRVPFSLPKVTMIPLLGCRIWNNGKKRQVLYITCISCIHCTTLFNIIKYD